MGTQTKKNRAYVESRVRVKAQFCERQNHRCCMCGVRMDPYGPLDTTPTWEHIIPKERGGSNSLANLVITCHRCNNTRPRGDTTYDEYGHSWKPVKPHMVRTHMRYGVQVLGDDNSWREFKRDILCRMPPSDKI